MPGFWLSSFAWTLPAGKVVLLATLWLRHGQPIAARDLLALVPEAGIAAALTLVGREAARSRGLHAAVLVVAVVLALASWLATASWAFAGAPVGFALLSRLALDPTTLRTALTDPALRPHLAGWLGGFVLVWAIAASAVWALDRAARRVHAGNRNLVLAACVAAALALAASRPAVPERRLALSVALDDGATGSPDVATDPEALAELAAPRRSGAAARRSPERHPIRNVVILVLESVRREPGTEFVDGFPAAIHLDRVYAHHPRSVKTLEAVLFGMYPSPGLLSAAWAIDHYDVDAIALPRVLAAHGFASHYFSAMQLGFDNYGGALAAAGFDSVETVTGGEALTWGAAAPELFARVAAVLERGAARREPQLVMAWTAECHMPYDHSGERVPAGDPLLRYRACQQALARDVAGLLERLAADGILSDTLVAVLGDHGQIFASEKAGDFGHGNHVHEPSLRVPLLLFVPGETGGRDDRLFQPVDLPVTILSALGIEVPEAWVGRDMLDRSAPGRSFVVALSTLSDGQAAVVDAAGTKLVRARPGAELVAFDLARDPLEEHGAPPDAAARRAGESRIASYRRIAASGWEHRRRDDGGSTYAFDGRALEARWAPGPCITPRLTAAGDLHVEPAQTASCAATADPFERRLGRAFDAHALAQGFTLRVTLDPDDAGEPGSPPRRALAKIWGRDEIFAVALDPAADGFQTVTLALPGPPAGTTDADTVVAFVGVEPPAPYLLRAVAIEPGAAAAANARKNVP